MNTHGGDAKPSGAILEAFLEHHGQRIVRWSICPSPHPPCVFSKREQWHSESMCG